MPLLRRMRNDSFVRNNVIFFFGSSFVAFLNYLYHPVLSRLLSIEEFGELQTILSSIFILSVLLTVCNRLLVYIEVNQKTVSEESVAPALFTFLALIHAPIIIGLIIFSPQISSFFAFNSRFDFAILALYIAINIPLCFVQATLQAQKKFTTLSIAQALTSVAKLILGALLVLLGLHTAGALCGLVLASLISYLYAQGFVAEKHIHFIALSKALPLIKKYAGYAASVCIGFLFVTLLYSSDVLIAKRLFDPETAGLYSGIATIARIIFFLTLSVSAVTISAVTLHASHAANIAVLKKSLAFITILGFPVVLIFSFFPSLVITTLLGERYLALAWLLPYASLFLFFASYVNVLVYYLLSVRPYVLTPISVIGCGVAGVMLFLDHASLYSIVKALSSSSVAVLVPLLYYSLKNPKSGF